MSAFHQIRAIMKRENAKWPLELVPVPKPWPAGKPGAKGPVEMWRSRDFLVQVYEVPDSPAGSMERLSVCRTSIKEDGRWSDNVTWDELQELKRQCGRGDLDAVEVYPRDADVVNVANMRHLWVFRIGLVPWAWRKRGGAC